MPPAPRVRIPSKRAREAAFTDSPVVLSTLTPAAKATKKKREGNCHWSDAEISSLVEQLMDAKAGGLMSDSGFKQVVWQSIAKSYSDPKKNVPRMCETKWSRIKKWYLQVKFLRELSGFGWDQELCVPTAEPQLWDEIALVTSLYDNYKE